MNRITKIQKFHALLLDWSSHRRGEKLSGIHHLNRLGLQRWTTPYRGCWRRNQDFRRPRCPIMSVVRRGGRVRFPVGLTLIVHASETYGSTDPLRLQRETQRWSLAHGNIVVSDPVGALARLQLGRAFSLSGDKVRAKAAYHKFLMLWKDADAGIPNLIQAKLEYAKLQ